MYIVMISCYLHRSAVRVESDRFRPSESHRIYLQLVSGLVNHAISNSISISESWCCVEYDGYLLVVNWRLREAQRLEYL